jgi:hypothetical protein
MPTNPVSGTAADRVGPAVNGAVNALPLVIDSHLIVVAVRSGAIPPTTIGPFRSVVIAPLWAF